MTNEHEREREAELGEELRDLLFGKNPLDDILPPNPVEPTAPVAPATPLGV